MGVFELNKFRNSNGRRYLQGLFYETTLSDKTTVVYTLKEQDHEGFPSLYRLYMETGDPTEYLFAVQHLDGWSHWVELSKASWFQEYVSAWREELATKLEAACQQRIEAIAADVDNNSSFQANKYLLESIRKPTDAKKRGRPSKGSPTAEETHQRAVLAKIDEDAKRLGVQ